MGYLVIFVKCRDFEQSASWKRPEDVPNNALRHFVDDSGRLSLYRVDSLADIPRLIAAFALTHRERLDSKDFIIADEQAIDKLGLQIDSAVPGDVPDEIVKPWHRDVVNANDAETKVLAYTFAKQGKCHRVPLGLVKHVVRMASDRGYQSRELKGWTTEALKRALNDPPELCGRCKHRVSAHRRENHVGICEICALASAQCVQRIGT